MENCFSCNKPVGTTCHMVIPGSIRDGNKFIVADDQEPQFLCNGCHQATTEQMFLIGGYNLVIRS